MEKENTLQLIENKIYEVRGVKVMLDFDLAEMYGMETKRLKEAVRRNKTRFPSDFMFELIPYEYESLRSQIATSNKRGGTRYLPFAFTEQGVAMLSSVLNSETAIEINIRIMRAFTAMRRLLQINSPEEIKSLQKDFKLLQTYIEEMFADQNDINEDTRMQMELINEAIAELQIKNKPRRMEEVGYLASLKRQRNKS